MTTSKNPVREMRESLNLDVKEFAEQAGVTLGTLRMIEGGGYLQLSRLLADKLASMHQDVTPERLKEGYSTWRRQMEEERQRRSQKRSG